MYIRNACIQYIYTYNTYIHTYIHHPDLLCLGLNVISKVWLFPAPISAVAGEAKNACIIDTRRLARSAYIHTYMHIYAIHTYMHIYTYIHTYLHTSIHQYIHTYKIYSTYIHKKYIFCTITHIHTHIHTYVKLLSIMHVWMHVCMQYESMVYVCIYLCMYICICMYVWVRTYPLWWCLSLALTRRWALRSAVRWFRGRREFASPPPPTYVCMYVW